MGYYHPVPNQCLEENPTTQSILFCGTYINLTKLAAASGVERSYLSKIFSRQRVPSIRVMGKLAGALGMSREAFLHGLQIEEEMSVLSEQFSTLPTAS
jgi:transcriptional regulator with XRE-family HTH domain